MATDSITAIVICLLLALLAFAATDDEGHCKITMGDPGLSANMSAQERQDCERFRPASGAR